MKCKVWLHSSRVVYFKTNFLIGIILHYFKLCTNSDTLLNREREREREKHWKWKDHKEAA